MHKFDRNIGLHELTFIDHERTAGITFIILLHMEKAENISMRNIISRRKDRAKEEMKRARRGGRRETRIE